MLPKGARRERVLPLLEHAGTSADGLARVRDETGVPEADVHGVASFYALLDEEAGHRVCQGLTCQLQGAGELIEELRAEGQTVTPVSCLGQCDRPPAALTPALEVLGDAPRGPVSAADAELAVDLAGDDSRELRALARAAELGPEAVIGEVEAAGLQGRGGAGFPAAFKWKAVRGQAEPVRYLVCNADEAEPGTFKDREVMLRRPWLLLEGLAIAARCVGAAKAFVYVRGEFQAPQRALQAALEQAAGTPLLEGLEVEVVSGHGAYICGEETALLESIEGKRGMPRLKPPFPTERGLWDKPTLIHNVETLACVPAIVLRGGAWFRGLGRSEPGTKLYCVSGHVARPGVYELPLGVTLDELVAAAGGYVGTPVAFSPGGASSGFLPIDRRELPLDFKSLAEAGSMLGSAGVVVLNDTVDLAQAVAWQTRFFEDESCGQCAPCRIGTRVLDRAVGAFLAGRDPAALAHVREVAWEMEEGSICGLGIAASLPVTTALTHFPAAFGEEQPS